MLLDIFYPTWCARSVYELDFEALYRKGFRGIIFDVDNTLVPHDAPADERARELFLRLHDIGFRCVLVSNNKEPRVKSFKEDVIYTDYVYKAGKPLKKGYLAAMERMGTDERTTLCIGDQIFTDTWGAGRVGIKTILTKPINPKEEIQIVLKRIPEKLVLYFFRKSGRKVPW
ncbi:MAG: YqeG family HAD IIIA-type phosphatase [Lachnospiraceae bacterium]|nr:YqeG family HAD IIIA-type phosphatase [Lachnospiraceae bacterium]